MKDWVGPTVEDVFGNQIWRWDSRVDAWRAHAYRYPQIIRSWQAWQVSNHQIGALNDAVCVEQIVEWPSVSLPELREEQLAAIAAWQTDQKGVVVMPTGTGKTEVALRIMADNPCSTLIVAPVRDLMYQWHRRILRGLGFDCGIIGDNTFNVQPVSVTTYDSASIHMPKLGNRFDMIVFDECHHLPGQIRRDAARMSIASKRLGLTATLERSDGRERDLEDLIGPTVFELSIASVRGRSLAEYDVIRIPVHLTDTEQQLYNQLAQQVRNFLFTKRQTEPKITWRDVCSESATDPASRQAVDAFRQKQAIENRATEKLRVLEDLFRLHQGSPILVFVGSNAMARDVSRRFLIPCLLSHCGKRERLEYLEGLRDHRYPALVANQVLDEGVDLPTVKVAVVIGGKASKKQAKQRLGRILRRQGNQRAVLYEIVCQDTGEAERSRTRRKNDAYTGTRHRRI